MRAGASNEFATPSRNASTPICQTCSVPLHASPARMNANTIMLACVMINNLRLDTRSATTPPGSIRNSVGRVPMNAMVPNANLEPVS